MAADADVCCPACNLVFPAGKGRSIPPCCDGLSASENETTFIDAKPLESDDRAHLAYLNSRIAHLDQSGVERRDEVQPPTICASNQVIPPIECLPDDALLDIFFHCTPLYSGRSWSDSFTRSMNSLDTCNAPWSLSQVCQRWRDICLSSRLLWCFVGVDLGGMLWVGPAEQYRLKLHLDRSGDLDSLYVNLSVDAVSEYEWGYEYGQDDAATLRQEEAIRRQLLDVLKATTRRWKGLRIHLPYSILYSFSDCMFGSLQELLIQYPSFTNNAPSRLFKVFETTPRLRTFALLGNVSRSDTLMIPRIAWSQITDFGNTPSPAWIAIEHLGIMKNLQRLNLGSIRVAGTSSLNGRPISLPFLTFLSIPRVQFPYGNLFSDAVRTPALKHLRLGEGYCLSIGLADLCGSRMFSSVTRLEIVNMNFTVSSYGLYQFLLVTPNVEHFEISSHLSVGFFQRLTLSDCGVYTNLLPRLRLLDITEAEYAIALDDCILDMLESRRAVLQELHTCTGFSWVGGRPDSSRWQRVRQVVRIVHTRETSHLDELAVDYDDDEDGDSDYVPGTDSESEYTSGMTDEDDED
ncbi:hypothetical protein BDZ89DRAFT_1065253 [Hymenopellis radicata]|nr:hypothetical protein BDZ89DRAFT_1065253 [Hymenopellis radicata]